MEVLASKVKEKVGGRVLGFLIKGTHTHKCTCMQDKKKKKR
jgi:hypothetical protein